MTSSRELLTGELNEFWYRDCLRIENKNRLAFSLKLCLKGLERELEVSIGSQESLSLDLHCR